MALCMPGGDGGTAHADLAVLACDSGAGRSVPGEGVLGSARLQAAGARRLVVGLAFGRRIYRDSYPYAALGKAILPRMRCASRGRPPRYGGLGAWCDPHGRLMANGSSQHAVPV